jgi:uroporphyrinogen-III decarboxylase
LDLARLKHIDVDSAAKTGRFGVVIESLRRINRVAGLNLALAAVVSGPLTLLADLTGRDPLKDFAVRPEETIRDIEVVAAFLLKVVQVYCQLELDVIAVVEKPIALCPQGFLSRLPSVFSPIVNTVRFYNAFSVLLPGESTPGNLGNLLDLGFNGIVAPGIPAGTWDEIRSGRPCILGRAIPVRLLNSNPGELLVYLETHLPETSGPGIFLTTDWELPPGTPPDNVHLLMNMMRKMGDK